MSVLTLALGAAIALGAPAHAIEEGALQRRVRTAPPIRELQSRAAALSTSSGTSDTTWVGYTPGHAGAGNYWSVYAGLGKDGYMRPVNGQPHKGVWDWDAPVNGDSLQGWWTLRAISAESVSGTSDRERPHTCLDWGNQANYVINESHGFGGAGNRTFGVNGVWHRDGGSTITAGGVPAPTWAPLAGSFSAWMGLRAHGDNTISDPLTGNPFNEDALMFNHTNASRASGTDKRFPGYGSSMDQMLYRDIDFQGKTTSSLTVSFTYRTDLSTGAQSVTRYGWFNHDPLGVTAGGSNPQPNNFISGMDAGSANAPRDSFMVYIGSGVDGNQWLGSDGVLRNVYDPKHRWFAEVLHADWNPASNPADPRPLYYKELLSVAGNSGGGSTGAPIARTFSISNGVLAPFLAKNNRIRLVFRVKTNLFSDDERTNGGAYSSGGAGAAVVDNITYQIGANPVVTFGTFETSSSINNDPAVSALDAWKSTGKPPAVYQHVEQLDNVLYEDLCGQKGDAHRICDLAHGIVSVGDHDSPGEPAGGQIPGQAEHDRRTFIASPTIQLGGPYTFGGRNAQGLYPIGGNGGMGDIQATDDYYLRYEIYTGIYSGSDGSYWRPGVMSYPSSVADASPVYSAWGQRRVSSLIYYNAFGKQCFPINDGLRSLIRTSNANGIPDSLKLTLEHLQLCYFFDIGAECSPTDGGYWDNVSLAIVDGPATQLTVDGLNWIQDAFPANETPGYPGNAALFDTTAALVKTGRNIAPSTLTTSRHTVPGDSAVVAASNITRRVDMVFRILPGPGNYDPVGDGFGGYLRKVPSNPATVTPGDGSYWDVLRINPGEFASLNAAALHQSAKGGWDPNVWVSVRCDTAEANLYANLGQGVPGGPPDPTTWMATIHEQDKRYELIGIVKNRCFVRCATCLPSDVVCNGTVPTYLPGGTLATTKEGTKIIPDGLLTPGSHVEYFFRSQDQTAPGQPLALCPDTNVVYPQPGEGPGLDGHRWQEFSVLPDRWKDPAYRHPVFHTFGRGAARLLVVDWADGRGDERAWVSVADTIGLTEPQKYGAHNGWHAAGDQDVNDPAARVAVHGGSPGTLWDQYQVRGATSADAAGSLGSRLSYTGGDPVMANKRARNAPTLAMLNAYYRLMLLTTGDLRRDIVGPFDDHSADDAGIIKAWLDAGSTISPNRGIWAIGDGFVEANTLNATEPAQTSLLLDYFRTDLVSDNFRLFSGAEDPVLNLRVFPEWKSKLPGTVEIYGMRNECTWSNDVLAPSTPLLTSVTSQYQSKVNPVNGYYAGVFKQWAASSPYKTLADGWDLLHLTSRYDPNTIGRSEYFGKIFRSVWGVTDTVVFQFPKAGCDSFLTTLHLTFNVPGSGSLDLTAKGPIRIARSDPYVCEQDGLMRVDTEIVDGRFEASDPVLGTIGVLVGKCHGLEGSHGYVRQIPGNPRAAESYFKVKPKFVFNSFPGTNAPGTCLEGGVSMEATIGSIPPACGTVYEPPPVPAQYKYKDCCTGEEVTVLGTLVHSDHTVCQGGPPDGGGPPPHNIRHQIHISDVSPQLGGNPGTTRIKLVRGSDCTKPIIDSGPVAVAAQQTAKQTAGAIAQALSAAIGANPNCNCTADTIPTAGKDATVVVDCKITYGTIGVCLEGTNAPAPGVPLGNSNNLGQNYDNETDQPDKERPPCCEIDPDRPRCLLPPVSVPPPDEDIAAGELRLELSPNPFSPFVTIRYVTSHEGPVTLEVFDGLGRLVRRLQNEWVAPGSHSVLWNRVGPDGVLQPGLYLVRLKTVDGVKVRKAINLR